MSCHHFEEPLEHFVHIGVAMILRYHFALADVAINFEFCTHRGRIGPCQNTEDEPLRVPSGAQVKL